MEVILIRGGNFCENHLCGFGQVLFSWKVLPPGLGSTFEICVGTYTMPKIQRFRICISPCSFSWFSEQWSWYVSISSRRDEKQSAAATCFQKAQLLINNLSLKTHVIPRTSHFAPSHPWTLWVETLTPGLSFICSFAPCVTVWEVACTSPISITQT